MVDRVRDQGEIELKFELDGRAARRVRRHSFLTDVGHQVQSQSTVYFDTRKGKVRKKGYSLRVRQVGDCFTQAVKTRDGNAGLFQRGEWEAPVEQLAPDPRALKRTPLGKFKKLGRKVAPVVCSDAKRTTWLVDRGGSLTEVVLDSVTLRAGDEETSFYELELELRAGEAAAMFDIAQELGQVAPLKIGVLDKEERGLMLADGAFRHEQKASEPDIHGCPTVGRVFASIVHECIRHFRLNEGLIVSERNPEALHQSRVAIRRLRAAFTLFRPAIRQGSLELLRNDLREFIGPFGEARNLDVFLDARGNEMSWRDRRKLKAARADAYDRVIDSLKAQRSRDIFLDLVEWTASEKWKKDEAFASIRQFAPGRLEAARKKVIHKGSGLTDLEERQLHKLRISIKQLRYAVEFLGPLYRRRPVRKFAASLRGLQDCLGLVHDDMVRRQISADFELAEAGRTDIADRSGQLDELATRFKHMKHAAGFWTR